MECRPRRGEAKSKKKRPGFRVLQKQAESRKQNLQEPNSDSVEGGKNEDRHMTSEENADTKHGDHQLPDNDLDDNTHHTLSNIKEESYNKRGENQKLEDIHQEQDGTSAEEGSDDNPDENQESEDMSRVQDDKCSTANEAWDGPQSFKDNDIRVYRQEDDTEGSGEKSNDSVTCGSDSSNKTSGSSSSTENEDKRQRGVDHHEIAIEFPLQGCMNAIDVDNLFKNENGKYEWQWRNENGWDEGRKHESANLEDVLMTRSNEKGFIIKTKNGYSWIPLDEITIDEATKTIFLDRESDLVERKTKIMLIGPVGSGKSATINTLLGEDKALSENNLETSSLTKEITEYKSEYGILVDTPGLTEEHLPSVLDYLERNSPDVIVIVFSASRLRSSQKEAIEEINTRLGTYFDKSVLLLTKGGDLQENEHDFIDRGNRKEIFSLYCSVGKRKNKTTYANSKTVFRRFLTVKMRIYSKKSLEISENSSTSGNRRHVPHCFTYLCKYTSAREGRRKTTRLTIFIL